MPEAGRVIAGVARGIRLRAPGAGTRPLGDRVKQSVFAWLGTRLEHAIVLDLFAGSGAAGIEALSRGAAHCDFVERDRDACRVIAGNLETTRLAGRGTVHRRDALAFLDPLARRATRPPVAAAEASGDTPAKGGVTAASPAHQPGPRPDSGPRYNIVIVDPPYGDPVILAVLERLGSSDRLSYGAVVVAKHFWRDDPPDRVGRLTCIHRHRYGETAITAYRLEPAPTAGRDARSEHST